MLLEYSASNFRSIGEEVTISARAEESEPENGEPRHSYGKYKVLPLSIVYGANGSGKTNVFESLRFLADMAVNSFSHKPGQPFAQPYHKLLGPQAASEFSVKFMKNGARYFYGFSIRNFQIEQEYLYYYPNGRQTIVFERTGNDIKAGTGFRKQFKAAAFAGKENRLFLSTAANLGNNPVILDVYSFFQQDLVFFTDRTKEHWNLHSLRQISQNEQVKKGVLEFLHRLDLPIEDLIVSIEKESASEEDCVVRAKVDYGDYQVDLEEESSGIQNLMAYAASFLDVLQQGKILVWDAVETSLHEAAAKALIEYFQEHCRDFQAQMIVSANNSSFLDLPFFRRDQIWFAQMKPERRETELYSLVELKNVRKDEKFSKNYLSGKYGAIPCIGCNDQKNRGS